MLYLASKSPRRRELLGRLGVDFDILDVDVPEHREPGEPAEGYVLRVAREKAGAGLLQVVALPDAVAIGADTEVVLDGDVFGKPRDAAGAAAMLRRLSGRTHEVVSVVVLVSAGREAHAVSRSRVTFAELSEADIAGYVASGDPMDRAGAYAIQGGAERFVSHLDGSYSGVMGLPLHETAGLLRDFGIVAGFRCPQPDHTPQAGEGATASGGSEGR